MLWMTVVAMNVVIALCYVAISTLVLQGLVRTRQLTTNPLALATAAIFATCALHHGHHALHLVVSLHGPSGFPAVVSARQLFGEWHSVVVEVLGAGVAMTYLGLRRSYKALLNTPAMFDDAVRVAAEARLRELAYTDPVTGAPNRAAYQQHADTLAATRAAVPPGSALDPIAVLFLDLDGFKGVNDTHGHEAGDRLLRQVAERTAAMLGPLERLFRVGGDEFVVVAVGPEYADAQPLVERVHQAVSQPVDVRGTHVVVTASIGVATGLDVAPVDRLVRDADADMYLVKAARYGGASRVPRQVAPPVPAALTHSA